MFEGCLDWFKRASPTLTPWQKHSTRSRKTAEVNFELRTQWFNGTATFKPTRNRKQSHDSSLPSVSFYASTPSLNSHRESLTAGGDGGSLPHFSTSSEVATFKIKLFALVLSHIIIKWPSHQRNVELLSVVKSKHSTDTALTSFFPRFKGDKIPRRSRVKVWMLYILKGP